MWIVRSFGRFIYKIIDSPVVFVASLLAAAFFAFLNIGDVQFNHLLLLQNVLIGALSIFLVVRAKSGLFGQVFGVFSLIAFCFFPILELITNTVYWNGSALDFSDRVLANIAVLAFLLMFHLGYQIRIRLPILGWSLSCPRNISVRQIIPVFTVCFLGLLFVSYLYDWSFLTFFFRGGENSEDLNVDSKASFLVVEFFLRPLLFNIGIFAFFFSRTKNIFSIGALVAGCIAVFPTGVPRFLAAALYMPFILNFALVQASSCRRPPQLLKFFLPNLLLFGLFFLFPLLDIFRWYASGDESSFDIFGLDTMLAGHFDGYQMLARAIAVGEVTYGYGFLGALFFFIPRSIWMEKPIGSAQVIAHLSDLRMDNVSMTLVGEFYLNFWFFGVVFGALLLGIIFRSVDDVFKRKKKYLISVPWIFYFQSVGLLLFILRGSFLSAFAYSAAIALTWVLIRIYFRIATLKLS